jgi:ABC-2 type transport system ATP-binding protein
MTSGSMTSGQGGGGQQVVVVQGLIKTFKDFWLRTRAKAVDGLTFHVERGEVFGLLGPNGSGKSTSIKIMLGLLKPTAGRVAVFGKPPSDVSIKKRIGYLPEESYLYPFLNARETLEYYAKLFQLDRSVRERRIDELLDMVGLASVQYRQVKEYSKGMQRRIGIAQALINDPELLILDEPTTGLDPIGTRQIKDLIIELGRRGKSIILSSHLLSDVEDCVDRMIILYGGKKQAEGTCDTLLTSESRSVIEADTLDEATIRQIDELIRQRTGGRQGIGRVYKPRQKLEDLFVDIVNRATRDRMDTSGARHGGQTAEFLRAGDKPEAGGAALLASLASSVGESQAIAMGSPSATQPPATTGPNAQMLDALSGAAPAAAAPGAMPRAAGPSGGGSTPGNAGAGGASGGASSVDRGLLDSLTDGGKG